MEISSIYLGKDALEIAGVSQYGENRSEVFDTQIKIKDNAVKKLGTKRWTETFGETRELITKTLCCL